MLHLDGMPLGVGRIVDVRVPSLPDPTDPVAAQAFPPAAVAEFVGRLADGLTPGSVADVVGRGDGLTPLGDDIVCGWLALHRAAAFPTPEVDAAVRACLGRTTLLSATLLDCALHGEVIPEFAAYVASLGSPDHTAVRASAAALAAVGHTSGTGLLYGARLALSALHLSGATA